MQMRLDKLLASTGRWSRREVKELVRRGRVTIDGAAARSAEEKVDAECARLAVDGEEIVYRQFTYIMLHKPAGVLSATDDARQNTVLDLLPKELQRQGLFPVGRLDKDTEGLLLLTNDGALAHALLAPKKHVDKVYYAKTDGTLTQDDCDAFAQGITLADGLHCLPAKLTILHAGETSEALVTLREGKFHQVKRMLAARSNTVIYLKRLQMGTLHLDDSLAAGAYRELTAEELENLRKSFA